MLLYTFHLCLHLEICKIPGLNNSPIFGDVAATMYDSWTSEFIGQISLQFNTTASFLRLCTFLNNVICGSKWISLSLVYTRADIQMSELWNLLTRPISARGINFQRLCWQREEKIWASVYSVELYTLEIDNNDNTCS